MAQMQAPQPVKYEALRDAIDRPYEYDAGRTDRVIRQSQAMVVVSPKHVRTAEDLVTTMWEVYQSGMFPELVLRFRGDFNEGMTREAMQELTKRREQVYSKVKSTGQGQYFEIGCGSVTDSDDLRFAVEVGFNSLVGPDMMVTGGQNAAEVLKSVQENDNRVVGPGIETAKDFKYCVMNKYVFRPDLIKIFPAGKSGAKQIGALLGPYAKDKYIWRPVTETANGMPIKTMRRQMVMPTGGQTSKTGPECAAKIYNAGYYPITGGSDPLKAIEENPEKIGNAEFIAHHLKAWRMLFDKNMTELGLDGIVKETNWVN